jgi:branched-chain amino acid transport system substrate-binding protein
MKEPQPMISFERFARPILLLLCGAAVAAGPASAEQGVTNDRIVVGMHSTLSGPVAVFGLAYDRAARLVFDDVNARGGVNGRRIELLTEDDRGDPGAGVAAVNLLMDRREAFLIYGGPYTPVTLAAFPRVIENQMIYWSGASSTPTLTQPFQRLTFQAQLTLDDQAIPVTRMTASMRPQRIAFIAERSEYGRITREATVRELASSNLRIATDLTIEPNAVSATAQVGQIKSENADVIIYGGTPNSLAAIIRELRRQEVRAPLVSFGGGSSAAITELVTTEAPIEFYVVTPLACALGDACTNDFMARWRAKYPNEAPIVWAAQGYAAARFFVAGLEAAGRNLTRDALVRAFESMPPFQSAELPYPLQFTAENHRAIRGGYLEGYREGRRFFFGDQVQR